MDATTRDQQRLVVSQRRIPPVRPDRQFFASAGIGEFPAHSKAAAVELCIEATQPDGEVTTWLTDEWWIRAMAHCEQRDVTVTIAPSAQALLNPVLLHQLEMLRRISPRWQIIGHARLDDWMLSQDPEQWHRTPCDEIRWWFDPSADEPIAEQVRQLIADARRRNPHGPRMHQVTTLPFAYPFPAATAE